MLTGRQHDEGVESQKKGSGAIGRRFIPLELFDERGVVFC